MLILAAAHPIVHVNAGLNALATVLLIAGLVLIKRGREHAHRTAMVAAFLVSAAFLVCYLWYHYQVGSVKFTHPGAIRFVYLAILISHIVLAVTVPFLAGFAMYYGYRALSAPVPDPAFRAKHRNIVKWAFPIWLYVSVTGVIVYVMLYHLWPSAEL
jgi:putative membrane protein